LNLASVFGLKIAGPFLTKTNPAFLYLKYIGKLLFASFKTIFFEYLPDKSVFERYFELQIQLFAYKKWIFSHDHFLSTGTVLLFSGKKSFKGCCMIR
jgi:hypothetical protein